MAIWHVRLLLAPRAAVLDRYTVVPATVPPRDAEEVLWWTTVQPPPGFEAELGRVLPEAVSWSEDMRLWGDAEGDDADVCYASQSRAVVEVGFRLDLRAPNLPLQHRLCAFAAQLDCLLLLLQSGALVAPRPEALAAAIAGSRAQRFVRDPVATLQSLSTDGPDEPSN